MKNKALKNIMVLTLVVLGFFAIYNMGTSKKQTDNSQEVQNTNDTVEEIKPSVQKETKTVKNVVIRILILIIIVVVISALIRRRNTEATASLKSNKKEKTNASKLSDESQTINDNNPNLNEHQEVNNNDHLEQNKEFKHQEDTNKSLPKSNMPSINETTDNQDTQQELIPSDNQQQPKKKKTIILQPSNQTQIINDNNPDLNEHEAVNDNDDLKESKELIHHENINASPSNNIPPTNETMDNQDTQQELNPSNNQQQTQKKQIIIIKPSNEPQSINDNNPSLNKDKEVNDNDDLKENKETSHQENINASPSNNNIPPTNEIIDNQDTQQELIPIDNEQQPQKKISQLSKVIIKKEEFDKLSIGNKKIMDGIAITDDSKYILTENVGALIKHFLVGNKNWRKDCIIVF